LDVLVEAVEHDALKKNTTYSTEATVPDCNWQPRFAQMHARF